MLGTMLVFYMLSSLCGFLLLLIVRVTGAQDVTLDSHWQLYKNIHGKNYGPQNEDPLRRAIFEFSVRTINDHNLMHDMGLVSYRLGLNKFADMTDEEFRRYKGISINATEVPPNVDTIVVPRKELPKSVDWRDKGYVTAVKDQQACGSCWAFSTVGSLEGQHFAKTGDLVSLSEQNLVDCTAAYGNFGCSGGLIDTSFNYIKANGGLDTEASYPYKAAEGECQFKAGSVGATLTGHVDVLSQNEDALKSSVASIGPVSVAIDASRPTFRLYKEGVYDEPTCSSLSLDHAVLVVGYGSEDGKDYWIVKNSWASSWGDHGYIKMTRNKSNQCGIATMASYPTV